MPYTATAWVNDAAPDIDATHLNNIETGISKAPYGPDGASGFVPVGDGSGAWIYKQITNAEVAAGAAIARSKLDFGSGLVNADIAAAAAISVSKLAGPFSTYVPVWSSSGTQPAIGNGTLAGRYIQIGKLVIATIQVVAGSTTTFGTGVYSFSVPVAAQGGVLNGVGRWQDVGVANYPVIAVFSSSTAVTPITSDTRSQISPTTPFTAGTGDGLELTVIYESV